MLFNTDWSILQYLAAKQAGNQHGLKGNFAHHLSGFAKS